MEHTRFDMLARGLAHGLSRRAAIAAIVAATGSRLAMGNEAEAKKSKKKKKKKKKDTLCLNGQTVQANKTKKKKLLKNGATAGACRISPPPPPPRPAPPACLPASADLQAAVNGVAAGSTLRLCAGRHVLATTLEISKGLTLLGAGAGQTILDGNDQARVLTIGVAAEVIVRDLTVTKGLADGPALEDRIGGGILNQGLLTLASVEVTASKALGGGGIATSGLLTLEAGSVVGGASAATANTATASGGGIFVESDGTMVMKRGSRVSGNTASGNTTANIGGGIANEGALTLEDGSVVGGDSAEEANVAAFGGGIGNLGRATLKGGSVVSGNTATANGGGILNLAQGVNPNQGQLTVEATGRVSGNQAPSDKISGIVNLGDGKVTLEFGALVCANIPLSLQCGSEGGGGFIDGICPNPGGLTC